MTLTKAIEAVKSELIEAKNEIQDSGPKALKYAGQSIEKALAALPDKPMTEKEIREKICRIIHSQAYCNDKVDEQWTDFEDNATELIDALKSAGVLFVKED